MSARVRGEYARLAARYDRRWARYVEESLALLRPFLAGSAAGDLLDVGCGTANLLPRLASWGVDVRRYAGADLAPEMLLGANAKAAASPIPAVLVAAEAEALPFRDASFDTVVSANSLHDWPDPGRALGEVRRVLRDGGRLLVLDWCRDALRMRAVDLALRISRNPFHRMYSRAEAAELLRGAGFRIVRQHRESIRWPWHLMVFDAAAE